MDSRRTDASPATPTSSMDTGARVSPGPRARDRDFSAVGRALASTARSHMLSHLMDGTVRPAGELARAAGVSASTASEHLAVLLDAGLVTCAQRGRGRFYSLSGPTVAHALEVLGQIAPTMPTTGYTRVRAAERLASGRFCYDHLAGRLGVSLTDAWVSAGWLDDPDQLQLTAIGHEGFSELGVDVSGLAARRRPTTRSCLDWTERRPHLAGGLGAAVADLCLASEWVVRRPGTRGVRVTESGVSAFKRRWGINLTG